MFLQAISDGSDGQWLFYNFTFYILQGWGSKGLTRVILCFVDAVQHYKYLNLLIKAYLEVSLKILNEDVFISWWSGAMVIVDMICWDKPRQVLPNNTDPRHNKNVCMKYVITTFNLTTRIFEVYRSSKYA